MGKKVTKAADNIFCIARYQAAEADDAFSSRESTSEKVGIDRTRLARIELGNVTPYPEEVLTLSKAYQCPELCNEYCSRQCPIGQETIKPLEINDFDRLILKVLGSTKDIEALRAALIDVAEDGEIDSTEEEQFQKVLDSLNVIAANVESLSLWAKKNIGQK